MYSDKFISNINKSKKAGRVNEDIRPVFSQFTGAVVGKICERRVKVWETLAAVFVVSMLSSNVRVFKRYFIRILRVAVG